MKPTQLIVWLLVAACIAIDLAMIGELRIRQNEWPEAGGVLGLGLVFSQVTLVVLWAVWGRNTVPLRAIGTLVSISGVGCLASHSATGDLRGVRPWIGLTLFYGGASLVPFVMARLAGYKIINQAAEQPPIGIKGSHSKQFTIWWLLSVMTFVGITLAVLRFAEFPIPELLKLSAFFGILAASACMVLLIALFLSRVSVAILAAMVILPTAGYLLSLSGFVPRGDNLELVQMTCIQAMTILTAVIVLRAGGYRLVRHVAPHEATASGSSDASPPESARPRDEP